MLPDRWLALFVRPRDPVEAELLPVVLLELGGRGVEETDGGFLTYLPPPDDVESFLELARARLGILHPGEPLEVGWRWQAQEDWAVLWRKGLGPRRVTPRLTVAPSWDVPEPSPGERLILLDPGMAFGTAEHATTRGCLRLLDPRVAPGTRIADVGAGSGILSIAAALLGAREVLALEMDPISCQVARENTAANGVDTQVRVLEAEVAGATPLPGAPYDGIVANLQCNLLLPILSSLRRSVSSAGWLILSGILLEEQERIRGAAAAEGIALEAEDREGEWWTGAFRPVTVSPSRIHP